MTDTDAQIDTRPQRAAYHIEQAKEGDVRSARELFDLLLEYMMNNEPIPEPLKSYFIPRFWEISKEGDALKLLHLNQAHRGHPKDRLTAGWDVVYAVINIIEEENLQTFGEAFNRLYAKNFYYSEDSGQSMSIEQITSLFYKFKDQYDERYGLPERIKQMTRGGKGKKSQQ